ncbi:MAG: 16S rRNA (cytidine(1402)-2'-O)-methyltransferase [Candidatus Aminicenantaceae bacterium]
MNKTQEKKGTLYVVATPIGNLQDITLRAIRALKDADFIACEDTRHSLKLLNHLELKKKLISYFHPREKEKIPIVLKKLREGHDVALVSDAGTPGLSDPGFPLIRKALSQDIRVIPVPGVSALTAALPVSGLPAHRFLFLGFPPVKKTSARKLLVSLQNEPGTLIFYIPVRKAAGFLELAREALGEREAVLAREITKIHEEYIRGGISEVLGKLQTTTLKGEATLLIRGA